MTNKKRSFISMLAGNKKKCCCDMEIVPEDKDTKQRLKKTGCCDMEIIEENLDSDKPEE